MTTLNASSQYRTRILLVDDSQLARMMVMRHLRQLGYDNFVEAETGQVAYEKLVQAFEQNNPIELVITDLRMPVLSGSELIKKIKKEDSRFKNLATLVLSIETERGLILDAVLSGAQAYLLKPVTLDALSAKLEQLFGTSRG